LDERDDAAEVLRDALARPEDPITVRLTISRPVAAKLLRLLEVEHSSGAVVVPVKEFYTTTESAALLGISRASLMKLIESGDIGAVKVGTHHRVPADELSAFQRARQVSRERASEVLTAFAFHSNVTFRDEGQRSLRERGEGHESNEQ